MDGFKRPTRPRPTGQPVGAANTPINQHAQTPRPAQTAGVSSETPAQSVLPRVESAEMQAVPAAPMTKRRRWPIVIAVLAGLVLLGIVLATWWYQQQLAPVNASDHDTKRVEIKPNASISAIANDLAERGLIRNQFAFMLAARLGGQEGKIKAGTCNLNPSESVTDILSKITAGCHDFTSIIFYPGGTLEASKYKAAHASDGVDKTSARYRLEQAGYKGADISAAFTKQYSGALFAGKPAGTSVEGYVFGETYYVDKDASVEEVLQTAFSQMESVVTKDDLVNKFKAQNLNLYQGITLASIVERELSCEDKPTEERKQRCYGYQQGIAAVFLNRLKAGMTLGSDVTFIYAADQKGVTPTVDIDSPYNTRKNPGLPPGPVATPGELAMKAVANPEKNDYLFFIAGDDGLIYFAKTDAEHQQNIKAHCQQLCSEL